MAPRTAPALLALLLAHLALLPSGCAPRRDAAPASASSAAAPPVPAVPAAPRAEVPGAALSPLATVSRFDSLLEAGDLPAARALCTGQVLRMFDFLAMAHARMAGAVDSARSTEDTLADSASGDWAYVKMASRVVFRRPFLGQTELASVQAIHLHRAGGIWRVAELEELEGRDAPVRMRSGPPPADAPAGPAAAGVASPAPDAARFLPVSPRAPERAGEADWVRLRVRLRNGEPLAERCPLDAWQRRDSALSPSEWILVSRAPTLPAPAARPAPVPDSLRHYLAATPHLVLEDSALKAAARAAVGTARDPAAKAAAIREWVTRGFRFQLGAVLFGDSRTVLRDMTGDCSEAAILAAALLRASGVPARVALGFASPGKGVFIGHAWTEAWLGPESGWVGVDAALGQFPAGPERVRLAVLDGRGDMRIAATNLMLAALSNLDIEILAARRGGKPLPLVAHPGAAAEGARFFEDILRGIGSGP